ncbi:hypothetical protein DACRYDRAFT_119002 [Dacryopinax primogenitus]|uniref:Uncharacterized protein n=1 Tax=Dacryopinax primogenitus (strain DJM 731) TaxID=1858805 RepID=M5FNP2_DACPD|nr:uncharacterized protein DACRYDRAFT_119002 [Dacryopinax primogenitus]EJT97755.1 hypothetical protein DACRYDRAFT_119002 [Dacryopinax primogenitus]
MTHPILVPRPVEEGPFDPTEDGFKLYLPMDQLYDEMVTLSHYRYGREMTPFPAFKHHSHPYLVMVAAHIHFQENRDQMSLSQERHFNVVKNCLMRWDKKARGVPAALKPKRSVDGDGPVFDAYGRAFRAEPGRQVDPSTAAAEESVSSNSTVWGEEGKARRADEVLWPDDEVEEEENEDDVWSPSNECSGGVQRRGKRARASSTSRAQSPPPPSSRVTRLAAAANQQTQVQSAPRTTRSQAAAQVAQQFLEQDLTPEGDGEPPKKRGRPNERSLKEGQSTGNRAAKRRRPRKDVDLAIHRGAMSRSTKQIVVPGAPSTRINAFARTKGSNAIGTRPLTHTRLTAADTLLFLDAVHTDQVQARMRDAEGSIDWSGGSITDEDSEDDDLRSPSNKAPMMAMPAAYVEEWRKRVK